MTTEWRSDPSAPSRYRTENLNWATTDEMVVGASIPEAAVTTDEMVTTATTWS